VSRAARRPSGDDNEAAQQVDQAPEMPAGPTPLILDEPNTELIEGWRGRLKEGEQRVLDVLLKVYPMTLTKLELALRSHYSVRSSSYEVSLAKLKRVGLIDFDGKHYRASTALFSKAAA
jgi:hypothetical protein